MVHLVDARVGILFDFLLERDVSLDGQNGVFELEGEGGWRLGVGDWIVRSLVSSCLVIVLVGPLLKFSRGRRGEVQFTRGLSTSLITSYPDYNRYGDGDWWVKVVQCWILESWVRCCAESTVIVIVILWLCKFTSYVHSWGGGKREQAGLCRLLDCIDR